MGFVFLVALKASNLSP